MQTITTQFEQAEATLKELRELEAEYSERREAILREHLCHLGLEAVTPQDLRGDPGAPRVQLSDDTQAGPVEPARKKQTKGRRACTTRYTSEQRAAAVERLDAGEAVREVAADTGISEPTLRKWRAQASPGKASRGRKNGKARPGSNGTRGAKVTVAELSPQDIELFRKTGSVRCPVKHSRVAVAKCVETRAAGELAGCQGCAAGAKAAAYQELEGAA